MTEQLLVDTPLGPGRLHVDRSEAAVATVVLGHGAGGGVGALDLDLLARRLPARGVTVLRFEQPWRLANRRVAVPPAQLDVGWHALLDWLMPSPLLTPRWFAGGRSAGARVACRTAADYPLAGVVCLAFPLHPPGRPERSRVTELLHPAAARLVVQGSRDPFGSAADVIAATAADPAVRVVELDGADHSFRLARDAPVSSEQMRDRLVGSVTAFLRDPSLPGG